MKSKTVLLLLFVVTFGLAVSAQKKTNQNLSTKTVRLHIDGFQKSKSGAV